MIELSTRYRVRPSFSVVAHSPDVVELRRGVWNPVSITVTDRSASGKLFRALDLMTGEATLGEIAERASLTKDEAKGLVAYLAQHDAVETEPSSAFEAQLALYHDTLSDGGLGDARCERLIVLGDGELAAEIQEQLADFVQEIPTVLVSGEAGAALTANDLTLSEDPLRFREEVEPFRAWQGGLLVVASLTVHPILLRNVNRIALHYGIPWLHAAADGPYLLIGPTFTPRRSSCYECFEARVAMSMRESGSYLRYKQALAKRTIKLGTSLLGRPFRGLLASLTALEVANLLTTGSSFTAGKVLSVFLPTLEFSFNEVLRVPGCPACSPITEQHEQGLYFDLKGYVNTLYQGNGKAHGKGGL